MNVTAILLSAGVMVVLGVLFGVILTIADKKFKVEVDPRVEAVRACLGGANCGACGYAGCDAFADAVVAGKAPVNGSAIIMMDIPVALPQPVLPAAPRCAVLPVLAWGTAPRPAHSEQ